MRSCRRFGLLLVGLALGAVTARGEAAVNTPDPVRVFLEERVRADPDDIIAWNRLGGLHLGELRRTGDFAELARAEEAAGASLRAVPPEGNPGGLALLARTALAAHRFAAAHEDALALSGLAPERGEAWALLGEADFELGDYVAAERDTTELEKREPGTSAGEIARSRLAFIHGDRAEAARRLEVALATELERTPVRVETTAWCRVQRGYLAFSAGDFATAEGAYRAALVDWPGWYVAEDHLAEVLAAKGEVDEAVRRYRALAERVRRPELWQALGDLLEAAGRAEEAAAWREKALAAYLAEAEAGKAHYYHHLAGLYADVRTKSAEAVSWARKDLETRQNVQAWDALGWALYRAKDYAGAAEAQRRALAQGTRDAHMFFHAALIFGAAGDGDRGGECLREAAAVNPRYKGFHEHR